MFLSGPLPALRGRFLMTFHLVISWFIRSGLLRRFGLVADKPPMFVLYLMVCFSLSYSHYLLILFLFIPSPFLLTLSLLNLPFNSIGWKRVTSRSLSYFHARLTSLKCYKPFVTRYESTKTYILISIYPLYTIRPCI